MSTPFEILETKLYPIEFECEQDTEFYKKFQKFKQNINRYSLLRLEECVISGSKYEEFYSRIEVIIKQYVFENVMIITVFGGKVSLDMAIEYSKGSNRDDVRILLIGSKAEIDWKKNHAISNGIQSKRIILEESEEIFEQKILFLQNWFVRNLLGMPKICICVPFEDMMLTYTLLQKYLQDYHLSLIIANSLDSNPLVESLTQFNLLTYEVI